MRSALKIFFLVFLINISYDHAYSTDVSKGFSRLAEKSMPSVVNISAITVVETRSQPLPFQFPPGSPFEEFFKDFDQNRGPQKRRSTALGSGFVIKENGTIITNNHVIQNAEGILVKFTDGKEYEAKLIGTDPVSDIAVLKIKSNKKFPAVKFADSDNARVGDWVLAIGNPFGLGGTVTQGIISAINRDINMGRYDNFIQTDASINQGNSGGPLFNMSGEVLGINTAIFSNSGGSVGIGFAIPANFAKNVIDQLIKYGETKRGWLGVRIQTVTKEIAEAEELDKPRGALVASVAENSPSEKAGIQAGDIILEFNGVEIKQMKELPAIVARTDVGKNVDVKIWRNKKEITKKVLLGRLETSDDFKVSENPKKDENNLDEIIESLRISVRPLTKEDIKNRKLPNQTTGLVITNMANNSPLVNSIEINSIIIEVQKKKIRSADDLREIIQKALNSNQKTILIAIYNNQNQRRYIGVKLD